jgi:inhibitor of KinA sporulation pathway (predicted exonuclease)
MYKFVCVLDFEATCDDKTQLNPQEIIEFPSVLLQFTEEKKLEKVSKFQYYVKPEHNPKMTKFCTKLTGITTEMTDNGVTFKKSLEQ